MEGVAAGSLVRDRYYEEVCIRQVALAGGLQEAVPCQPVQLNRDAFPSANFGMEPKDEGVQMDAYKVEAMNTEERKDSAEDGDSMSAVSSLTMPSVEE